jgi:Arc/MetJ-type ribon-helix-helix transcriptional regulator
MNATIQNQVDSEKINLGYGQIDILVREGFYSNRTDFIRTAIRNQLDRHNDVVKQSVARHQLDFGLRHYSRQDLETVQAAGEMLHRAPWAPTVWRGLQMAQGKIGFVL